MSVVKQVEAILDDLYNKKISFNEFLSTVKKLVEEDKEK